MKDLKFNAKFLWSNLFKLKTSLDSSTLKICDAADNCVICDTCALNSILKNSCCLIIIKVISSNAMRFDIKRE